MVYAKTKYSGAAKLIAKDNGVALRELGQAFKAGYQRALVHWHEKYRPLHFTRVAYLRYGYLKRAGEKLTPQSKPWKRSYTGRKWAAGPRLVGEHHTNPLVWSGRSRTLAAIRDVRATSKGGRCAIHARALNWKKPQKPDRDAGGDDRGQPVRGRKDDGAARGRGGPADRTISGGAGAAAGEHETRQPRALHRRGKLTRTKCEVRSKKSEVWSRLAGTPPTLRLPLAAAAHLPSSFFLRTSHFRRSRRWP